VRRTVCVEPSTPSTSTGWNGSSGTARGCSGTSGSALYCSWRSSPCRPSRSPCTPSARRRFRRYRRLQAERSSSATGTPKRPWDIGTRSGPMARTFETCTSRPRVRSGGPTAASSGSRTMQAIRCVPRRPHWMDRPSGSSTPREIRVSTLGAAMCPPTAPGWSSRASTRNRRGGRGSTASTRFGRRTVVTSFA
jgi:hypothetical protein